MRVNLVNIFSTPTEMSRIHSKKSNVHSKMQRNQKVKIEKADSDKKDERITKKDKSAKVKQSKRKMNVESKIQIEKTDNYSKKTGIEVRSDKSNKNEHNKTKKTTFKSVKETTEASAVKSVTNKEKTETSTENTTEKKKKQKKTKKHNKKSTWKTKVDNKGDFFSQTNLIALNLSHKETKETIQAAFSKYGDVEDVEIITNKDKKFQGKALIKYKNSYDRNVFAEEITMNNKIIKVVKEKIKKESETNKSLRRVFLNHMDKDYKIIDLRNIIKKYPNLKVKDIRIKNEGPKMRNPGYCFIEFKKEEQAKWFVENFNDIRIHFGDRSQVEFSNEKISKIK